jgi:WD40 repeat protein
MEEVTARLHACSIERLWRNNVFACGTYELNEAEKVRDGEIVVFEGTTVLSATTCDSGVLDMKYARSKLCVALSHGALLIFSVDTKEKLGESGLGLLTTETCVSFEDEGLFLSVDIDMRLSETCWSVRTLVTVSTQVGSVLVYAYEPAAAADTAGTVSLTHRVASAHMMLGEDMPSWIAFFNPHTSKRIVSGGDDMVMKVWDLPEREDENTPEDCDDVSSLPSLIPVSLSRNRHTAGVTSGQWHPVHGDIFATGSYDEHVRIWDQGNVAAPLLELHTGTVLLHDSIFFHYRCSSGSTVTR